MQEKKSSKDCCDSTMAEFLPHVAERFCPQCGEAIPRNEDSAGQESSCSCSLQETVVVRASETGALEIGAVSKTCPVCGKEFSPLPKKHTGCAPTAADPAPIGGRAIKGGEADG